MPAQVRDTIRLMSFDTACGLPLDAGLEIATIAWVLPPQGIRPTDTMFICQADGDSMWPLLPNGAYGLFDKIVGTRAFRYVLVEDWSQPATDRFTLKRYESILDVREGQVQRVKILLHPLNPKHEIIELDENNDEIAIRGVWLQTIAAADLNRVNNLYTEIDDSQCDSANW